MSARFVCIDRETPMLLPADMREWVADDDLAHFVLAAVEAVELSQAKINERGCGSAQYPPSMLLAVLIYSYATGIFSSRLIEKATWRHVSVRYLAGDTHPDHDTICSFRRENKKLIEAAFARVLELAQFVGLGRVGTVCLDGTKILANAAKRANASAEELEARECYLSQEIEGLLQKAEEADSAGLDDGTSLPQALAQKSELRARVRAARALLEQQVRERAEHREKERAAAIEEDFGDPPRKLEAKPKAKELINGSDPESALVPQACGGFVQGYNAQMVVTAQRQGALIIGTHVCAQSNDREQLPAGVASISPAAQRVEAMVTDTGYDHARHIRQVEKQYGLKVYCPPQKSPTRKEGEVVRQSARRAAAQQARAQRKERMRTEHGQELMALRRMTIEPIFGQIKECLGFRRFRLRGLEKVNLEWQLVAVAFNCRRVAVAWRQRT